MPFAKIDFFFSGGVQGGEGRVRSFRKRSADRTDGSEKSDSLNTGKKLEKQVKKAWSAGPMERRLTTNQEIAGSTPA